MMGEKTGGSAGSQGDKGNGSGADEGTIKVGDKVYTTENVQSFINQQEAVTKQSQTYAAVDAALGKYDIDAEGFISQADGAFSVLAR